MAVPKELPALPTLSANNRITGTDRDRLSKLVVRHYKNGTSCREIGEALGRSYGFVHKMLEEAGIDMRARGGAQQKGTGARSNGQAPTADQVSGTPALPAGMKNANSTPAQKRAAEHVAAKAAAKRSVPSSGMTVTPIKSAAATAARAAKKSSAAKA